MQGANLDRHQKRRRKVRHSGCIEPLVRYGAGGPDARPPKAIMPAPKPDQPAIRYELKMQPRPGYLYAYVHGPVDTQAIDRSYFSRIAAHCRQGGFGNVLIEEDLGTQLSTTDIFEVVSASTQLARGTRIAFVDRHASHRPGNLFGETVAVNRGVQVKVCDTLAQAEAWLAG